MSMPKLLRWVLIGLGLTYGTYLVAGNALLWSQHPLIWINGAQSNVKVKYAWAWSLLPGHVWAGGVEMVSKDTSIEVLVSGDRASSWISIPRLFDKTFRLGGSVDGVAVRIRKRRTVEELCDAGTEHTPPIPGLASPLDAWAGDTGKCLAQMETAKPKTPEPTPKDDLWRIDIDDVDTTHIREFWYESLRVAGEMHGDVSFYLWPTSKLRIPPARLVAETATVGFGANLEDGITFSGQLDVEVREVTFDDDDIKNILESATATVTVTADVKRLSMFDAPGLRFHESSGHLSAKAILFEGAIQPGSRAVLENAHIRLSALDHRASLVGGAKADVTSDELTIRADLVGLALTPDKEKRPVLTGKDLTMILRSKKPRALTPITAPSIDVELRSLDIPDVVVLNETLGATGRFQLRSGAAHANGELHIRGGDRLESGQLHLESTNIVARYADLMLEGQIELDVPIRRTDKHTDLAGTKLSIREGRVREPKAGETKNIGWWAGLTLTTARLEIGKGRLEAHTEGRMASIRPLLAVFGAQGKLPGLVRDFDPGPSNLGFDLTASKKGVAIEGLDVKAEDSFHAQANYYAHDGTTDGGLLVSLGPLTAGVEIDDGKTNINVFGATGTFQKNATRRRQLLD